MARFYAEIQGNRGAASRMGSDGIWGHIRGWSSGVRVDGYVNDEGKDCFTIYLTSGSGGGKSDVVIGNVIDGEWTL